MSEVCVIADLFLLESHMQKHTDSSSVDVTVSVEPQKSLISLKICLSCKNSRYIRFFCEFK